MAEEQKYALTTDKGETLTFSAGFTGKGVATYPNGDIYDGEFLNGVRHGKGKYTYGTGENPDKYEGQWENNEKNGIGRMFYSKGGEYFGNFLNGKRSGEGMFTYANKDIYSGNWLNGKKHGKGTYVFFDTQSRYAGDYFEGKIIQGDWILSNQTKYCGNFKHNQPNGQACWTFKNGNKVHGEYQQQLIPKVNENINIKLEWVSK